MARVVAIDLGRHAAKAAVYETAGRSVGLEGYFTERVADDGEGRGPSLGARLAALDRLLSEHHTWQSPATIVGLVWPTDDVSTRVIQLPFTDKTQLEQTLPFTVEEVVPFDMDKMLLAWRAIPGDHEGTKAHVTLVRTESLRTVLEALQSRSVDPRKVVVDGEALGVMVSRSGGVAVVDVGHSSTAISVLLDGVVVGERAIDVGGRRFTQAIAAAMDLSFADAERLKHGEFHPDEEPTEGGLPSGVASLSPQARTALDGVFGLLLAEIRSTLIAAEDQHGLEIDSVFLTGGGARLEPLPEYLQRDLGLNVEWLAEEDGEGIPPEHGVARALAQVLAKNSNAVNLRTGPLAFKGGVNVLRAVVTYGTAGVAFFLVAATVVFAVQFMRLRSELNEVDAQIRSVVLSDFTDTPDGILAVGDDAAAVMEAGVLSMEERADVLAGEGRVPPTVDQLLTLTNAFPDPDTVTVNVSDLTVGSLSLTFNAETDTYESAAAIETSIQAVEAFADAVKSNERRARDKVTFTMTIPLNGSATEGGE